MKICPIGFDYAAATPVDPRVAARIAGLPERTVRQPGGHAPARLRVGRQKRSSWRAGSCSGRHRLTLRTEHKAALDCMREPERIGFAVTQLAARRNGMLDLDALRTRRAPARCWPRQCL